MFENTGNMAAMMNTQAALMQQIYESSFAMDDAVLFLDTHPNSVEALQYFKNMASMRANAVASYESQFGPLFAENVTGDTWSWQTEFWPWEGGC